MDYCHLNDPFSDDEDEAINIAAIISNESFSVAANNGVAMLKEEESRTSGQSGRKQSRLS